MKRCDSEIPRIDVFLTHAPARGLGTERISLTGALNAFHEILDEFHPRNICFTDTSI